MSNSNHQIWGTQNNNNNKKYYIDARSIMIDTK